MASKRKLTEKEKRWLSAHPERVDIERDGETIAAIIRHIARMERADSSSVNQLIHRAGRGRYTKDQVLKGYKQLVERGDLEADPQILERLQLKPTRTISGVAPVAVMTKPFPCPGECIFCPDFPEMPKSYLPDEPGALRAEQLEFDPFLQTERRIRALSNVGHSTDKIELIVLGGTWSSYPHDYQEWFLRRCFDAMNGHDSLNMTEAQKKNETASHRNVGIAVETRPDQITDDEIVRLRSLGVTKVQIGIQSLNDQILLMNRRGYDVDRTREAFRLLRAGGFKIHAHWMPNLLGATPASDREDFDRLWSDPSFRPDELKIYPCSLIPGTELHQLWREGGYVPYTDDMLVELVADCKTAVPPYCRITRIMRDIPKENIAAGCTQANLRQVVHRFMADRGMGCDCIRCREIRKSPADPTSLTLNNLVYETDTTEEHFLSFDTPGEQSPSRIAGFLRLSLPQKEHRLPSAFIDELTGAAMIREVHVYGPAIELGQRQIEHAQHGGLGTRLVAKAEEISREAGYQRLAVISAIGTREYYRARGFALSRFYMTKDLD
jgi:elongator complex protein 3